MRTIADPIDEILDANNIKGPWEPLPATGLANRIYATKEVVIRVAREHDEALRDARTESIAAPIVYKAGLLTPKMLVFDDSRTLVDGPYSIWERVQGETLGFISSDPEEMPNCWRQTGAQMAKLHTSIQPFADPKKHLHEPRRDLNLNQHLKKLVSAKFVNQALANELSVLISELYPAVHEEPPFCFLHSDIKAMNIMCTKEDELLALIDWGDSGWGDPTFEFRQIPLSAIPYVLEGYNEVAPALLGDAMIERFIWDKLADSLSRLLKDRSAVIPIEQYQHALRQLRQ